MRVRDYTGSELQQFQCTLYNGYMGFLCHAADNGSGGYLGLNGWVLWCSAKCPRENEHIDASAHPDGGFTLRMMKSTRNGTSPAPLSVDDESEMKVVGNGAGIGFQLVS